MSLLAAAESALKRLERVTRTDITYLVRGGFWLVLQYIISIVLATGLLVIFSRFLSPELYGVYKFILAAVGVFGVFSLTGISPAVTRSIAQGYRNSFQRGYKMQMLWGLAPIALAVAGFAYYYATSQHLLAWGFLVAGILAPLSSLLSLYEVPLLATRQFRRASQYAIIQVFAQSVATGLAVVLHGQVIVILVCFFGSVLLVNGFFLWRLWQYEDWKNPDGQPDIHLAKQAKDLSVVRALARIAKEADSLVIFQILGARDLAFYSFALLPVVKLSGTSTIVKKLGLPKLSTASLSQLQKTLPKKILFLVLVMGAVTALYIVFAPFLFKILFPAYQEVVPMSQVLAVTVALATPSAFLYQALLAHLRTRAIYITQTVYPILKIALTFLGVALFGLWGAVAAFVVAQLVYFAMMYVVFLRA